MYMQEFLNKVFSNLHGKLLQNNFEFNLASRMLGVNLTVPQFKLCKDSGLFL